MQKVEIKLSVKKMQFDAILREKIRRKPLRISFSALRASIAIMASMTSHYEIFDSISKRKK